jgi:hypothetical protein
MNEYRSFLSMKAFAAGYALIYVPIKKLQLVNSMVVGLTEAKFKPVMPLAPDFSLSSNTYIWIFMVMEMMLMNALLTETSRLYSLRSLWLIESLFGRHCQIRPGRTAIQP